MEPLDPAAVVREVRSHLRAHASAERREKALTYFSTALEVVGVAVPDLRLVVRALRPRLRGHPAGEVLAVARALIDDGTFEGRQVAYELLAAHPGARQALDDATLRALGAGADNWASVDTFATLLAGPAWREGRLSEAEHQRWLRSEDRFRRRTAVVMTVALNSPARGGRGEVGRTLAVCEAVVGDRDDMVVKALSWALRELVRHDPEAVRAFLARHEGELAARVVREVGTKLRTGRKSAR